MTYNGWTNYETWAVGMYLDGNYTGVWTYEQVNAIVAAFAPRGRASLADALKEYVATDTSVDRTQRESSIAADLLGAALGSVNWLELADAALAELEEQDHTTTERNEPCD